jgi:4-amino-4-deoxy-L-arabinose transferase-like glycosyltransferase
MTVTLDRSTLDAASDLPRARPAARRDESRRARLALVALLGATAVLYLWGLSASGWANGYYAAAVQAGTKSWKAFFFGSSDAANFITTDKAPASLWVMDLSARVFGLSSWSILVPQALEGVAAVGVLYATVRRWFTPGAGLLAGAVLATTPVAALMFRFNNPDALLVLLLTCAAYAMTRAIESGHTRWLVLVGGLIGFGFLAKMLQAFLVVPGFAMVYLVAAPPRLRTRIAQVAAGGAALVAAAGWWVVAVQLVPAADRPYIGGSQDNTLWNLIFGYNGFGRLTGNEAGSVGGGGPTGSRWGPTGWTRLFNSEFGGQIAWLLPAALVLLGAGLFLTRRAPRTNRTRAAFLLWGSWLVVTAAVFSLGAGIIHPYYTVALAPAIGALVGIGGALLWRRRATTFARWTLAATVLVTAVWVRALLNRTPDWHPELRALVLVTGIGGALGILVAHRLRRPARVAVVTVALVAVLAGPAAYAVATAATPHSGAIPSAGPSVTGTTIGAFGPTGGGGGAGRGGFGFNGGSNAGGGPGGLLNTSTPQTAVVRALEQNADRYTWVAAVVQSNQAAGYQLATGDPVMAIGGFNGTDPAPTLAQFQALVRAGRIHYFIAGGGFGGGPGGSSGSGGTTTAARITAWVESHFTARSVGGVTVYDLTG